MVKLLNVFFSVKTAVVLLFLLSLLLVLSMTIPQNQAMVYYSSHYGPVPAWLIVFFGLYQVFNSLFFFTVAVLFIINLACCTLRRIYKQIKLKKGKDFWPDLFHVGLLAFTVSAFFSAAGTVKETALLSEGESVMLSPGKVITLNHSDTLYDNQGRVQNYRTEILVGKRMNIQESYEIMANKPVVLEDITIHQLSFLEKFKVELASTSDLTTSLIEGQSIYAGDDKITFLTAVKSPDYSNAMLLHFEINGEFRQYSGTGLLTERVRIIGLNREVFVELLFAKNQAFPAVMISFLILIPSIIGLGISRYQREKKRKN